MTWDRLTYAVAIPSAVVAVVAGVVSFGHIESLALSVHQPIADARLLPLAVDGLIVAGSVVILGGYWLGWLGVASGAAATLFANVQSGLPYGPLSATVAAWPAVAFLVASFILERWLKRQVSRGGQSGTEVAQTPRETATLPDTTESVLATLDQHEPETATCGHEVAGTPEERVVAAYLHERDCLGQTPSQRRLAATHNVSRPKVATLVGSLNGGSNHG